MKTYTPRHIQSGFTLIELSIVLVIIGLITGGVLVGNDLINAAAIRSQISQLEKYNIAVRTFQGKYGQLPGDMDGNLASQFGFIARSGTDGRGDNNGVIISNCYCGTKLPLYPVGLYPWDQAAEALFFWEDLSQAGMIDGLFNTATDAAAPSNITSNFDKYFPAAKIGSSNFVTVYSGGFYDGVDFSNPGDNFFTISVPQIITVTGNYTSNVGMTVHQAYNIDKKLDDGLPLIGKINTLYNQGTGFPIKYSPSAATDSATTCYNTTSNTYSIATNKGTGVNCALSFKMQ